MRAARVVDLQVRQHRGFIAERADVVDVRGLFLDQNTCFLCWRKPPTRRYSSREVIAQPPPVGPSRSRTPFTSICVYS